MAYKPERWLDAAWNDDGHAEALAVHEEPEQHALVSLVNRLEDKDCALVAIAGLTRRTYSDVLRAVTLESPTLGRLGLGKRSILRVLKRLGHPSVFRAGRPRRSDAGVVVVSKTNARHAAIYFHGLVFDELDVWEFDTWLAAGEVEQIDGIFVAAPRKRKRRA